MFKFHPNEYACIFLMSAWIQDKEDRWKHRWPEEIEVAFDFQLFFLLFFNHLGPLEDLDISEDRNDNKEGSVKGDEELGIANSQKTDQGGFDDWSEIKLLYHGHGKSFADLIIFPQKLLIL